jgi:hypothetical protein
MTSDTASDTAKGTAKGTATETNRPSLLMRVVAWGLVVLTAILVPLATLTVWAQATVFDADKFVELVDPVISDPEVINGVSTRLTDDIFEAVGPKVLAELPPALRPLARLMGGALHDRIESAVADAIGSDAGQQVLRQSVETAHRTAMRVLNGDDPFPGEAIDVADGVVVLDLKPLITRVLLKLELDGVISGVSSLADADGTLATIAGLLGFELSDDFGTVVVYRSDVTADHPTLAAARNVFELIKQFGTIILLVTFVVVALTVVVGIRRPSTWVRSCIGVAAVSVLLIVMIRRVVDKLPDVARTPLGRTVATDLSSSVSHSLVAALVVTAVVTACLAASIFGPRFVAKWSGSLVLGRVLAAAAGIVILLVAGLGLWSILAAAFVVVVANIGLNAARMPVAEAVPREG